MGWFGTEDLGSSLKMLPLCDLPTTTAENWELLLGSHLVQDLSGWKYSPGDLWGVLGVGHTGMSTTCGILQTPVNELPKISEAAEERATLLSEETP